MMRDFLIELIDDAAGYRARDDSTYCADCWNGQCDRHAGDHARELEYVQLLRVVEESDGDEAAVKAFLASLPGAAA